MSDDPYRPRTWAEVVGQPTDRIRALLDGRDTDESFLFYGPSGTGKTTVANLIAMEVQGSPDELMVMDNSEERGIDTVRDTIIPAARRCSTLSGAPVVIFIDEVDGMTPDAQEALRGPVEKTDAVFIFACNDLDAVHPAIRSRCQDYEFGPVAEPAIKRRVRQIADAEGVDLSDDHLAEIASYAEGDVRKAIQRYTQIARGAYEEERTVQADSRAYEREARQFLDGED